MKALLGLVIGTSLILSIAAHAAGDVELGRSKAAACVSCHGNETFPGIFYTLQLAGRNADKIAVKTNKYRTGKIVHPLMNLFTMNVKEDDIADIAAYYQSLGKPAMVSPLFKIKGDDDAESTASAGY